MDSCIAFSLICMWHNPLLVMCPDHVMHATLSLYIIVGFWNIFSVIFISFVMCLGGREEILRICLLHRFLLVLQIFRLWWPVILISSGQVLHTRLWILTVTCFWRGPVVFVFLVVLTDLKVPSWHWWELEVFLYWWGILWMIQVFQSSCCEMRFHRFLFFSGI